MTHEEIRAEARAPYAKAILRLEGELAELRKRCGDLAAVIGDFDVECASAEHTDVDDAWWLFHALRRDLTDMAEGE